MLLILLQKEALKITLNKDGKAEVEWELTDLNKLLKILLHISKTFAIKNRWLALLLNQK